MSADAALRSSASPALHGLAAPTPAEYAPVTGRRSSRRERGIYTAGRSGGAARAGACTWGDTASRVHDLPVAADLVLLLLLEPEVCPCDGVLAYCISKSAQTPRTAHGSAAARARNGFSGERPASRVGESAGPTRANDAPPPPRQSARRSRDTQAFFKSPLFASDIRRQLFGGRRGAEKRLGVGPGLLMGLLGRRRPPAQALAAAAVTARAAPWILLQWVLLLDVNAIQGTSLLYNGTDVRLFTRRCTALRLLGGQQAKLLPRRPRRMGTCIYDDGRMPPGAPMAERMGQMVLPWVACGNGGSTAVSSTGGTPMTRGESPTTLRRFNMLNKLLDFRQSLGYK